MRTLLVLAFGSGVAQATLAPWLALGPATPDIPLVVVAFLALRRGPEAGCVGGFVAGLLQDAAGGGLLGVQALTKALAGFAIGLAGTRLRVNQPLVQVTGLVLLTVLEGLARYGLLALFRYPAALGDVLAWAVLPQALYNGFLGAAVALALTGLEAVRARSS